MWLVMHELSDLIGPIQNCGKCISEVCMDHMLHVHIYMDID